MSFSRPSGPSEDKLEEVKRLFQKKDKVMVLMRGCPGSGKTYVARRLLSLLGEDLDPADFILSTDDYFTRGGVYNFDFNRLSEAHDTTRELCKQKARAGHSPIIIDNTNTKLWHMKPYAITAANHGYKIVIIEPDTPWFNDVNELFKRNTHGVSKEKMRNMYEDYDRGITPEMLMSSWF